MNGRAAAHLKSRVGCTGGYENLRAYLPYDAHCIKSHLQNSLEIASGSLSGIEDHLPRATAFQTAGGKVYRV
jgi:hypothetical protein